MVAYMVADMEMDMVVDMEIDFDMYFFEFWAIQLRITGPKEIQSPERLYKYATIVGNRFSFQYDILSLLKIFSTYS